MIEESNSRAPSLSSADEGTAPELSTLVSTEKSRSPKETSSMDKDIPSSPARLSTACEENGDTNKSPSVVAMDDGISSQSPPLLPAEELSALDENYYVEEEVWRDDLKLTERRMSSKRKPKRNKMKLTPLDPPPPVLRPPNKWFYNQKQRAMKYHDVGASISNID